MRLQLIPSAVGGSSQLQFLSSYLLNDELAIDGGSLGLLPDLARQRMIRHLLLTHAHADHIATLGVWLDNVFAEGNAPTIYCLPAVADALRTHYFNDVVWPDLQKLPSMERPAVRIRTIDSGETITLGDLSVTAVAVNHAVPAAGFVICDARATLVFSGDTGPTEQLWKVAAAHDNWHTTVLEVAFPNHLQSCANVAGHLTPATFAAELPKLPPNGQVYAVHLKSAYREQIAAELTALAAPNCKLLQPGEWIEI